MDQRSIVIALAVLVVLGLLWYAFQTPSTTLPPTTPPPATTPGTPPAP